MANELRVWAWPSFCHDAKCPCQWHKKERGHNQVTVIVAARSKAEVARIAGYNHPARMWNLTETGNERQIKLATAREGKMLHSALDDYLNNYFPWLRGKA